MNTTEKAKELNHIDYDTLNKKIIEMAKWKDDYHEKLLDLLVKSGADPNIITDYIKNCTEP